MDRSCGNCSLTIAETERLVQCKPDLLPAVWHRKEDVCRSCGYFKPRELELHMTMLELRVEYYQGENKTPIAVVAKCDGGNGQMFVVGAGAVMRVRLAGWVKTDHFYTEGENRYRREIWRPCFRGGSGSAAGLPVVVSTRDEI